MNAKCLLAGLSLGLLTVSAHAQNATAVGTGVGIASSRASSASRATAISGQGGNGGSSSSSLTINNPATTASTVSGTTTTNVNTTGRTEVVNSGTATVRTNAAVFAPGLAAAGLETCLGSASGGVSVVGFGLTGGSSYPDEGCQARLDSRTLWSYGLKSAAVARLCLRPDIYRSMPDVCTKYTPRAAPVSYPAPVVPVSVYASAEPSQYRGGNIMLVDGKTGLDRLCSDYDEPKAHCRHWADAAIVKPRTRTTLALRGTAASRSAAKPATAATPGASPQAPTVPAAVAAASTPTPAEPHIP